jgi:UDP-3-O-[3-hydroxymyristoyl] glucosamine N-acyltransferase
MILTLAEIARQVEAALEGDGSTEIRGVAPIEHAVEGDISFVANERYKKFVASTGASALVLAPGVPCHDHPVLRHENPYLIMAQIIDLFYPERSITDPGVHPSAIIHPTAKVDTTASVGAFCHIGPNSSIGKDSQIAAGAYIGENVVIGAQCRIYPGARIMNDSQIGHRVILHPGVVIGSDGFGFAKTRTGLKKIQQVGWVEIEDDVEIGANTTIDRGAMGPTRIGRGTKIDNLVQIAHNVEIGEHCIIVSQVGISGSTKLGNGVVLAGQVGLVGHIEIGDGVQIGAQSGVSKSIPAGKRVFGYPARDFMETARIEGSLTKLPELLKRVHALEKKLSQDSGGE